MILSSVHIFPRDQGETPTALSFPRSSARARFVLVGRIRSVMRFPSITSQWCTWRSVCMYLLLQPKPVPRTYRRVALHGTDPYQKEAVSAEYHEFLPVSACHLP